MKHTLNFLKKEDTTVLPLWKAIKGFALAYIEHLIRYNWSPEQITGHLQQHGWLDAPSHE